MPNIPAVDGNRSVLTKLFFGFVNLTDKINEAFAHLWNALFWPVCELELTYCS